MEKKPILPKLLLVDDEEPIQQLLRALLEKQGFGVVTANSGKTAIESLGRENFDAIISDINMPGVDGLELLKHVLSKHPKVPVILMTGFTKIVETKAAFALGAKGFLAKPFMHEELMSVLKNAGVTAQPKEKEKAAKRSDDDASATYCRISIDQFISGKKIHFPIFISITETKYIKVAHKGEDIDLDRIHSFKSKGVEFLHIRTEDFAQYVGLNLTLSRAVKNSKTIPREKKLELAKHASAAIMENLCVNGVNKESMLQAKEMTENTLALLSESPESFNLLELLRASGDPLYTHSLGVSLYSAMIAKQVGWTSPATLFKISTAGIFHDIGMKEIDKGIVEKHRSALTVEEIKQLETHPARAAAILGNVPSISDEVLQTILQHHESLDGRGYPSKLSRSKIIPMARLIAVADEFCELAVAGANSPGLSAKAAIDRLSLVQAGALDAQFLNALKTVMGLDAATPPGENGA